MRHKLITLTYAGHTLSIPAWSRWLGMSRSTLYRHYYRYPDLSHAEILGVQDAGDWRGHPIVEFAHEAGECLRYFPDLAPCPAHGHPWGYERPCAKCGLMAQPWVGEAMTPDPCLGWLPGVQFACCGHGQPMDENHPYVSFTNGQLLEDAEALAYFAERGCHACL
jgi:hypothetical protein